MDPTERHVTRDCQEQLHANNFDDREKRTNSWTHTAHPALVPHAEAGSRAAGNGVIDRNSPPRDEPRTTASLPRQLCCCYSKKLERDLFQTHVTRPALPPEPPSPSPSCPSRGSGLPSGVSRRPLPRDLRHSWGGSGG